jgi:hypothetical protein
MHCRHVFALNVGTCTGFLCVQFQVLKVTKFYQIFQYMLRMNDPNWQPPPSALVSLSADNFTKYEFNSILISMNSTYLGPLGS